jgi:glycosyltransferase involved in cell wall biosynthesis
MRIGINALSITPNPTGGGTTYISELTKHLSHIDHCNDYVLFVRADSIHHFCVNKNNGFQYGENFKFVRIPILSLFSVAFRIFFELLVMPLLTWRYKLDILLCPGDAVPLWVPCISVMVIQNLFYFHSDEVYPFLVHIRKRRFHTRVQIWYYSCITSRSALKADRIITVSENAKKEIVEFLKIDPSRISVVYHGVGTQFRSDNDERNRVRKTSTNYSLQSDYLLYVGAVVPYKNVETLIAAFSLLKDRRSILDRRRVFSLVVAGPDHWGYASYVREVADKLGVLDQIIFLGYVPYDELPSLYQKAEVSVLLSLCESFGMPILEAMACGCPVVCSNTSSLPEIAGDAAVLVDPKNPMNVADAIEMLLKDEEFRRRMIDRGKSRVVKFSWNQAAHQTLSVIKEAVENCHSDRKREERNRNIKDAGSSTE